jgi:sigma-B regulation protein RsbU (phosphoserine phosphatase)
MNRTISEFNTRRWMGMNKSYLTSKTPPDRYALFMRGNLLVFAGYVIAALETFIAIYFGLTDISYEVTFFISLFILIITTILISITYFTQNLLVWQEWAIFGIYLITFLFAFCLWVYWLGAVRILGILNALTAVTIVLSYTNVVQSLLMSMSTLICYYTVTWYAIRIDGQPGSLEREAFLSFCLFPAFLLISAAADYINKKREALQAVKNELEILNDDLSDANDKLKKEQMLQDIEMDLAREIQGAIFPRKVPATSDWEIAFMTRPYGAVSGDFYDFYIKDNSLKGVSLFDVSGHGVAPALITILAKPVLYFNFNRYVDSRLGVVLESANTELLDELEEVNLYITGLLLRMNGSEVEYVNAGHPDLLHLHAAQRKVQMIADSSETFKGHPIGISHTRQEYQSVKFTVPSGDFLIFYSDGLTEGRNCDGEQFGIARLSELISSFNGDDADSLLKYILESFFKFTGNEKAGDDITIIVAKKL